MTQRIDWNEWRANYPWMTHQDQCGFMDRVYKQHPKQEYHDLKAVIATCERYRPKRVFEMGGWDGKLAEKMLERCDFIVRWLNFDLCRDVIDSQVETDRYGPRSLPIPLWKAGSHESDLFIACAVIEHLTITDLCSLIKWVKGIPIVHLQSPLHKGVRDWNNYHGSHILPIDWEMVTTIMWENRYLPAEPIDPTNMDRPGQTRVFEYSENRT